MASKFSQSLPAKKIFSNAIIALYKDLYVSQFDLIRWAKLSLCFEDPTKSLKSNMLVHEKIPRFMEPFESGVCVLGFGYPTYRMAALGKYWTHEWIMTAILGRHTVDYCSHSPLVQYNNHCHVTAELIERSLKKFIGEIEQTNPGQLYSNFVDQKFDNKQLNDSEKNEIENFLSHQMKNNKIYRMKKCYSIEVLSKDDREIKFRIISDGLFNCRSFIRDFGTEIDCMSSIDSLHLVKVGPIGAEQALKKLELHYDQMLNCAQKITPLCINYLKKLRIQYPNESSKKRYI